MKKIIKGKLYNTETARQLGCYENIADAGNFSHYEETLYRKKTGEFFLYGKGGPASKYSERVEQNTWFGSSDIIPISYENARQWAEDHLAADNYQEIFGEVSEDAEDRLINFMVSAALDKKLTDKAAELGTSKSDILRRLIENM